ncbi:MAG: HPr family phosphocarrier protein [Candidatus Omnitrophica bacterium]|nr:HPr family phosphocarrier protein [Candidatus Omnitrophota bacterium]
MKRVPIKKITLIIQNRLGLHARPAALFVQMANRFKSSIEVQKGRTKANGKSIMGIMTLAAGRGSQITIRATGPDAVKAVSELIKLIRNNFGE